MDSERTVQHKNIAHIHSSIQYFWVTNEKFIIYYYYIIYY